MAAPEIRSVRFAGHTTLGGPAVELRRLNVLVGPNGAGKSNFINALELLGRIADDGLEGYVDEGGGAARFLRQGANRAESIELAMDAPPVHFNVTLAATADDRLILASEEADLDDGPRLRLAGERRSRLREIAEGRNSAVAGGREAAELTLSTIQGCRVYHFHDTADHAPMKVRHSTADNLALKPRAENLAPVLLALQETEPAIFQRILGAIRLVAPFFRDFVLKPEGGDTVRLRWRGTDPDTVFSALQLSDGTLRFICLSTLLLQPVRPSLIVLDEPELGLHPFAINQLVEMLRSASVASQVVVATQSVTLLDQVDLDDVVVVELDKGISTFHRPERAALEAWLDEYSLGEIWLKNLIGGRPKPASGGR